MNPIDKLISSLDGLRQTGPRRWLAKCPAHDDRSPSLSIAERDDGAALIHCHGGCSVHEVVAALGLQLHDLFPPTDRDRDNRPRQRASIPARDILETLATESLIVLHAAADTARGTALSESDTARLWQAVNRFSNAYELATGRGLTAAERHQLLTRGAVDVVA